MLPTRATRDERISESVRSLPAPPLRGLIAAYDGYRRRGVEPAQHLGLPSPYMTLIVTLDEPLQSSATSTASVRRGALTSWSVACTALPS